MTEISYGAMRFHTDMSLGCTVELVFNDDIAFLKILVDITPFNTAGNINITLGVLV